MLYIYIPYKLKRDRSIVDDIPGIIVDSDKSIPIEKNFINDIELYVTIQSVFFVSINSKIIPIVNVIKKGIRYDFLKPFFVASFKRLGMVPRRKPVKIIYVSDGQLFKHIKIILLKRQVPMIIPRAIGNKNKKFSFGFLNKVLILFKHFSYNPKMIKRALPLNPGTILKIPTNIPFIKFIILNCMLKANRY